MKNSVEPKGGLWGGTLQGGASEVVTGLSSIQIGDAVISLLMSIVLVVVVLGWGVVVNTLVVNVTSVREMDGVVTTNSGGHISAKYDSSSKTTKESGEL